jgi:phosphatidylglycerol:prolipoprotein diacylglycerol transferase
VLFLVLRYLTHSKGALKTPGVTVGTFLVGYGLARSFSEFFRQPDPAHYFTTGIMTPGIAYSLPMIALGIYFIVRARRAATEVAARSR